MSQSEQLRDRTKQIALGVIRLLQALPEIHGSAGAWKATSALRNLSGCKLACRLPREIQGGIYLQNWNCRRGSRRKCVVVGDAWRI